MGDFINTIGDIFGNPLYNYDKLQTHKANKGRPKDGLSYQQRLKKYENLYNALKAAHKDVRTLPNPKKFYRIQKMGGIVSLPSVGVAPVLNAPTGEEGFARQARQEQELQGAIELANEIHRNPAITRQDQQGRAKGLNAVLTRLRAQKRGILNIKSNKTIFKLLKGNSTLKQKLINILNDQGVLIPRGQVIDDEAKGIIEQVLSNALSAQVLSTELTNALRQGAIVEGWEQSKIDAEIPAPIQPSAPEPAPRVHEDAISMDHMESTRQTLMREYKMNESETNFLLMKLSDEITDAVNQEIKENGAIEGYDDIIEQFRGNFIQALNRTIRATQEIYAKTLHSKKRDAFTNTFKIMLRTILATNIGNERLRNIVLNITDNLSKNITKAGFNPFESIRRSRREAERAARRIGLDTSQIGERKENGAVIREILRTGKFSIESVDRKTDLADDAHLERKHNEDLDKDTIIVDNRRIRPDDPPDPDDPDDGRIIVTVGGRRFRTTHKKLIAMLIGAFGTASAIVKLLTKDGSKPTKKTYDVSNETPNGGFKGERHTLLKLPDGSFKMANWLGPRTNVLARLKRGDPGLTATDWIARRHDIDYAFAGLITDKTERLKAVRDADKRMVSALDQLSKDGGDSSFNIEQGRVVIKAKMVLEDMGIMNPELFIGMGDIGKNQNLYKQELLKTNDVIENKAWTDPTGDYGAFGTPETSGDDLTPKEIPDPIGGVDFEVPNYDYSDSSAKINKDKRLDIIDRINIIQRNLEISRMNGDTDKIKQNLDELRLREKQLDDVRRELNKANFNPADPSPYEIQPIEIPDKTISLHDVSELPMSPDWVKKYIQVGVLQEVKDYNQLVKDHIYNMTSPYGAIDIPKANRDLKRLNELYSDIKTQSSNPGHPAGTEAAIQESIQELPMDAQSVSIYKSAGVLDKVKQYNSIRLQIAKSRLNKTKAGISRTVDLVNQLVPITIDISQKIPTNELVVIMDEQKRIIDYNKDHRRDTPAQRDAATTRAENDLIEAQLGYANAVQAFSEARANKASGEELRRLKLDVDRERALLTERNTNFMNQIDTADPSTYLRDAIDEVQPSARITDEVLKFKRIQQLERVMKQSPGTASANMYDTYVDEMGRPENKLSNFDGNRQAYFDNRKKLLQEIYKQFDATIPDPVDEAGRNIDPLGDDVGADALIDPTPDHDAVNTNKSEDFTRASYMEGGEALVLASTPAEQAAEMKRWADYSRIKAGFGMGHERNALYRENLRADQIRFRGLRQPNVGHKPQRHVSRVQRQQPRFLPVYQFDDDFEDDYNNTAFKPCITQPIITSVNERKFENDRSIYFPEHVLRHTKAKATRIPRMRTDGQRFAPDNYMYGEVDNSFTRPSALSHSYPRKGYALNSGCISDNIPYDNAWGFPHNARMNGFTYDKATKTEDDDFRYELARK